MQKLAHCPNEHSHNAFNSHNVPVLTGNNRNTKRMNFEGQRSCCVSRVMQKNPKIHVRNSIWTYGSTQDLTAETIVFSSVTQKYIITVGSDLLLNIEQNLRLLNWSKKHFLSLSWSSWTAAFSFGIRTSSHSFVPLPQWRHHHWEGEVLAPTYSSNFSTKFKAPLVDLSWFLTLKTNIKLKSKVGDHSCLQRIEEFSPVTFKACMSFW